MYENQINEHIFFNKRNGKYIEIGAGEQGTATLFFEKELGWTGILVEPNPVSYKKLQETRPNSIIYRCPISECKRIEFHSYYGQSADMSAVEDTVEYDSSDIGVVYYNDEIIINEKKTIDVLETRTLTEIINESYDFMVIDVNGHEINVLESWDFSQHIEYIIFKKLSWELYEIQVKIMKINNYSLVDELIIHGQTFDVWKKDEKRGCIIS
jgi:FkbM family methyltransferase